MGVLNVTPDSFSDGGSFLDPGVAVDQAQRLAETGADIIDVGAESTRPGAATLSPEDEWARLGPVLARLVKANFKAKISVDTRKPDLMLRVADMGVAYINDVGGATTSTAVLEKLARYPALQYIAMHMKEAPETMQREPLRGAHAVGAVDSFFTHTQKRLGDVGFSPDRVWLDPGIGFGKSDSGNLQLIAKVSTWAQSYNLCVGVSRKGFIGRALDISSPEDRDAPSKMLELGLAIAGAQMIRTHAVKDLRRLIDLLREDC